MARVDEAIRKAFLNVGKEKSEPPSKAEDTISESPTSNDESIEIEEVKKRLASGEWEIDL